MPPEVHRKEAIPSGDRGLYATFPQAGQMVLAPRREEATTTAPWKGVDLLAIHRRGVAESFARDVGALDGVESVWLTDVIHDLEVAVITRDFDLDLDLEIRRVFLDAISASLDGTEGEIFVYGAAQVPDRVSRGRQLLPHD